MPTEGEFQAQLALLRRNFVEQLPKRLAELQDMLQRWLNSEKTTDLATAHRLAHNFTGSGATYGLPNLSQVARELEQALKAHVLTNMPPTHADINLLRQQLAAVAQEIARAQSMQSDSAAAESKPVTLKELTGKTPNRLLYLLDDDDELREPLILQIEHFGYTVKGFASTQALRAAVQEQLPALIIANVMLPEGEVAGITLVLDLQKIMPDLPPVIFISSSAEFKTRLSAVRAGGQAYFTKPLRIEAVVDAIDALMSPRKIEDPFRVLVVDDVPEQAQYHALLLRRVGMKTRVVSDSMAVMDALTDFSPELILMDMHMPDCSGMELTKVIRQQPGYMGVPIVFLSAETDRDLQLEAMRLGGDDFLTKSITDEDMMTVVSIRAARYRMIRALMVRDSLTGLLNHSTLMERLRSEMGRSIRHGHPLSFAMIDIDHFKNVNDTYGHAMGDRVIKSLARLLQERLRSVDIVGRYGGEEIAVIMPDTPVESAVKVMDQLRQCFAAIEHHTQDQAFFSTFSCGVAALPPVIGLSVLVDQADQRMYVAKHGGRNRVVGPEQGNIQQGVGVQ
ncbi:MAG: diguanylate cyclase [Gammaproteobacteria bacterium]|nr:diguanylate cyclase [Gammaproteobacteria bacterium]